MFVTPSFRRALSRALVARLLAFSHCRASLRAGELAQLLLPLLLLVEDPLLPLHLELVLVRLLLSTVAVRGEADSTAARMTQNVMRQPMVRPMMEPMTYRRLTSMGGSDVHALNTSLSRTTHVVGMTQTQTDTITLIAAWNEACGYARAEELVSAQARPSEVVAGCSPS